MAIARTPRSASRTGRMQTPRGHRTRTLTETAGTACREFSATPANVRHRITCPLVLRPCVRLGTASLDSFTQTCVQEGNPSNDGTSSRTRSQLALLDRNIWASGLMRTSLVRLPAGATSSSPFICIVGSADPQLSTEGCRAPLRLSIKYISQFMEQQQPCEEIMPAGGRSIPTRPAGRVRPKLRRQRR